MTEFRDDLEHNLKARDMELAASRENLIEHAARLEKSNEELQNFAFIASHDLKEPLRKILAFGGRLTAKYGESLGREGNDFIERMMAAANRMSTLLDALLNLSRISTRGTPFIRVNLREVIQDAISDMEVAIDLVSGKVEVGELPEIEGDAVQFRQLFQNLISNAMKYRRKDEPPMLKISGHVNGKRCQLCFEDNGIGFHEKHLERIFQPFQRLHGRQEYEGVGMGLAICRKIVERHGGTITASSIPGQGSTFIITIPVNQRKADW